MSQILSLALTLAAPSTTNYVWLNSPKWYLYFPFEQFVRILLFILRWIQCSLQCEINSYSLPT